MPFIGRQSLVGVGYLAPQINRILTAVLLCGGVSVSALAQPIPTPGAPVQLQLLQQPVSATNPLPTSQAAGSAGTAPASPSYSKPGTVTLVPLDAATVTTAGTPVTALTAGHATAGGYIVTSNAAGICVNQVGAAGTTTGGSTVCVVQNQTFNLTPSGNAVSVNSTASGVALAGYGYQ